jgi:HD superfamily phosphohydrolase YqeK
MTNKERFITLAKQNIQRTGLDKLLNWLEKSDFYTAPASTNYHGNYEGGLLEHSLNVYDALIEIAGKYCNGKFTLETLTIVSLFHDICKTYFYKKEIKNKKIDGFWREVEGYTINDKMPLGHGEKSAIMLQSFITLSLPEMLAIRWHMGGFDSAAKGGDYGLSKASEITQLVPLLQIADMIASNLMEVTNGN